jgi:hypothetical protein
MKAWAAAKLWLHSCRLWPKATASQGEAGTARKMGASDIDIRVCDLAGGWGLGFDTSDAALASSQWPTCAERF